MIDDVLSFWFEELDESQWYVKDAELDNEIIQRFNRLHQQAAQGELWTWRAEPNGSLAEIIILDQFSRNMICFAERQSPLLMMPSP